MGVSFTVFEIKRDFEKRQFLYPLPFNFARLLETSWIFPHILIQTVRVPKLSQSHGAKILPKTFEQYFCTKKSSTLWVGRNNVTDRRRTDGRTAHVIRRT